MLISIHNDKQIITHRYTKNEWRRKNRYGSKYM